jgi:hypothetical protein
MGTTDDEECDVRFDSSIISAGNHWCGQPSEKDPYGTDISCEVRIVTNPGARPITDMWITIPTLSNTRLGYTWLDGIDGRLRFSDNRMVLGVGTSAFTVADTVGFGITNATRTPLVIDGDKTVCLGSTWPNLTPNTLCTKFGANVDSTIETFTTPATASMPAKTYVLLGNGYYQQAVSIDPVTNAVTFAQKNATSANNITLFQGGSRVYAPANRRLADAFIATSVGNTSKLNLYHYTADGSAIDLVGFDVRVSGALAGTTSSTLSRGVETFVNSTSVINSFLARFTPYTTTSAVTSTTSTSQVTNNITVGGNIAPSYTITSLAQIASWKLNGNDNVYAFRGNLTIGCVEALSGVKTIIVENGSLTINCNNSYADAAASWAFIVKDGDIRISNSVTSLVGVYVTIDSDRNSTDGRFVSADTATTTNILNINGSLYGDATSLFSSRVYVRGTNAYDTLTTGVILSYSNRALVSPPPMLSQYLNNYSVTRVVR